MDFDLKCLRFSRQISIDRDGTLIGEGDVEAQTIQVYEIIKSILEDLGGSLDSVVKLTTFYTQVDAFPKIAEVRRRYFSRGYMTASSSFAVSALAYSGALVEVEAIAVLDR